MELLERVVETGGQLLRVERDPAGLLLTFDVGRVRFRATPGGDGVAAELLAPGADASAGAVDAGEQEPWWRLLGNPLTAVWPEAGALRLRFRPESANPKVVRLAIAGGGVQAVLEQ